MLALLAVLAVEAAPFPRLVLPVRCTLGSACLIQKLPDHGPGPVRADHRCGTLTTDAHDGVDFRIADNDRFREGVPILAAAAGRVIRTRDGEPDLSIRERGTTGGRDAGNGVVIDHGGGWTTQYSHARRGSIAVRPGQTVAAGEPIALVGLSGNTEYPHLHFTVRHDGTAVDPFTSDPITSACRPGARTGMWRSPLPYQPTALVAIGWGAGVRDLAHPAREAVDPAVAPNRPLILWADVIGAAPGDEQLFTIRSPDGRIVVSTRTTIATGGLTWFAVAGRRPPPGGWPAGRYGGRFELRRAGRLLLNREADVMMDAPRPPVGL